MMPSRKIGSAAAIGVPLSIMVAWALGQLGVVMSPEVTAALGSLLTALVGYLVPDG